MSATTRRLLGAGLGAALAASLATALPAAASTTLSATAHGVVDFGDGVDFTATGPGCAGRETAVRVLVGGSAVEGPRARGCAGVARVPGYEQVRAAGWRQGDPLVVELASGDDVVPLRYQRLEVDQAAVAAGAPQVREGTDPDTGPSDRVLALSTGDAVDLGRADVQRVDSIALRLCITQVRPLAPVDPTLSDLVNSDVPVRMSLHQDSPTGPALVHEVDVSSNPTTITRLPAGFGGTCWRLVTLPVTGRAVEAAPRLFLRVDAAAPGTLLVNALDLNGTGGRSTAVPNWVSADPPGMRTVFDGSSFEGWTQSGCALRDGAATNARSGARTQTSGCSLTQATRGTNRVIRLELRAEDFYDNGGISVPTEIQLRAAGEYLPGGYFPTYAARWQKLNSWPAWSQLEIVQLGGRYVVRLNGRTVTDVVTGDAAPAPYALRMSTQPNNAYRAGAGTGFGNEAHPDVTTPDEWGAYWFRNVRVYECTGLDDPVCTSLADVNAGQAPKAEG